MAVCWFLSVDVVQEKGFELMKTTSVDIAKDITVEFKEKNEEEQKSKIHDWSNK